MTRKLFLNGKTKQHGINELNDNVFEIL